MRLNTLKPAPGSKRSRLRVGRGASAGQGKTCGRGTKGQRARKGGYHKVGFEGGQMPLQRRMPKMGFRSAIKSSRAEVTLGALAKVDTAPIEVPARIPDFFTKQSATILGLANMFTGGALARLSIFAMGVMPYISASIIVQMMSMVLPSLQALRKEGESGRRKITQYTRYLTVPLAMFQAYGAALALESGKLVYAPGVQFLFVATATMTAGTAFLMWLGEQITERGMGNGISMIILTGIVANIPLAIGNTLDRVSTGEMSAPFFILRIAVIVVGTRLCRVLVRAHR